MHINDTTGLFKDKN